MAKSEIPSNNKVDRIKTDNDIKVNPVFLTSIAWIIVILVILLALLIAFILSNRISNGDSFTKGITCFSTILSIILSISSISFAYYTSQQTSRQYENMSMAVTEIKASNGNMENNNRMLLKFVRDITKEIGHLGGLMENPKNQIVEENYPKDKIPQNNIK